jgi:predicted permease
LCGGALGLILAHFGIRVIVNFFGANLPRSTEIGLDGTVLAFTFVVAVLTGIFAGLAPALRLTSSNISDTLKLGLGRTDSVGGGKRLRGALVVSEVALSLMLLVGAGLMVRTLSQLQAVDPGFDPNHAIAMNLVVGEKQFSSPVQETAFMTQVLQRVRAISGVDSAGEVDDLPLIGGSNEPVAVEGQPAVQISEQPEMQVRMITPNYLKAMGVPFKRGRDFTDADGPDSPSVVIISESLAKRFWPNQDAIGKRLALSFYSDKMREVVGVVGDVKQNGLDFVQTTPTVYFPMAQDAPLSPAFGSQWGPRSMWLVVRSSGVDAGSLVPAVKNTVQELDRDMPVRDVTTLDKFISDSLSQPHFNMILLGAFAALAVVLAALGIFSVLSYSVRRRVREIGIRMALGAQVRDVLRLIVGEGMKPVFIGVVIGVVGALLLGRLLSSMMFGVSASDPITFASVSVLLVAVAFCASLLPAYRATRVEPVRTLRDE